MDIVTSALIGLFLFAGATASSASTTAPTRTVDSIPTYKVAMTGYNPVVAQTDADPSVTASGAVSNPEVDAARSDDLADKLPFGTIIEIDSTATSTSCGFSVVGDKIGYRVITDAMNAKMHNKIDIMFGSQDNVNVGGETLNSAIVLGKCTGVNIRAIGQIDLAHIPQTQAGLEKLVDSGEGSLALGK